MLTAQLKCLAQNIYFEARNSNLADKAAVTDVVLNRVASPSYPNTICKVIHQRHQFSWYWDGKSDRPKNRDAWEQAKWVAYQMLYRGTFRGITEGALMYHATYVNPKWAKDYYLIGTIGKHKFYRQRSKR